MTEHTPGPWTVNTRQGSRCVCIVQCEDNDWENVYVNARDTYPRELMGDDARLIAGAPDLLAACEAAYDAMMREDFGTLTLAPQLKAAIAKARGEATDA